MPLPIRVDACLVLIREHADTMPLSELVALLLSKGFSSEEIRQAIRMYLRT